VPAACLKVSPTNPKGVNIFQRLAGTKDEYTAVSPRWVHTSDQIGLGNICWVNDLFLSNRERLYKEICNTLLNPKTKEAETKGTDTSANDPYPKIPFCICRIPGDGRCGFRFLGFRSIFHYSPFWRQFFHCKYMYLYTYNFIIQSLLAGILSDMIEWVVEL